MPPGRFLPGEELVNPFASQLLTYSMASQRGFASDRQGGSP